MQSHLIFWLYSSFMYFFDQKKNIKIKLFSLWGPLVDLTWNGLVLFICLWLFMLIWLQITVTFSHDPILCEIMVNLLFIISAVISEAICQWRKHSDLFIHKYMGLKSNWVFFSCPWCQTTLNPTGQLWNAESLVLSFQSIPSWMVYQPSVWSISA